MTINVSCNPILNWKKMFYTPFVCLWKIKRFGQWNTTLTINGQDDPISSSLKHLVWKVTEKCAILFRIHVWCTAMAHSAKISSSEISVWCIVLIQCTQIFYNTQIIHENPWKNFNIETLISFLKYSESLENEKNLIRTDAIT